MNPEHSITTHEGPYDSLLKVDGSPAELRRPQVVGFTLNRLRLGAAAFRVAHAFAELAWRFGAKEAGDAYGISYDEWQRLTGLNPRAIRQGILDAVESGVIEVFEPGAGRRSATYRLRPWTEWTASHRPSPSEAHQLAESARSTSPSEVNALHRAKRYGSISLHHPKFSRITSRSATDLLTSTTSTLSSSTEQAAPSTVPQSQVGFSQKGLDRVALENASEDAQVVADDDDTFRETERNVTAEQDVNVPTRQDQDASERTSVYVRPRPSLAVGDRVYEVLYGEALIERVLPGGWVDILVDHSTARGRFDPPLVRRIHVQQLTMVREPTGSPTAS